MAGRPFPGLLASLARLGAANGVLVQTHDYPDHDAVAAAFGLARLLEHEGLSVRIAHRGLIRSSSLEAMVRELDIPIELATEEAAARWRELPCVLVDGNPQNDNARPLTPRIAGVIDHHRHARACTAPWSDLREDCGSCASLVASYWAESGRTPDRAAATALLIGIQMDTDFLCRGVHQTDLEAFHRLFFLADWEFSQRVIKSSLSLPDLGAISSALDRARTHGPLLFSDIPMECSQELVSIVADFLLRLKEIDVVAIVETGGPQMHLSVRSRRDSVSAALLIQRALAGLGAGGGHDHMAGGSIEQGAWPGTDELYRRFEAAFDALQEST